MPKDLTRGDIPTLILAVLAQGSNHGYGIARMIERESDNLLQLREGSLYPALRELEQGGFIVSHWETEGTGPAKKVYDLTPTGQVEFDKRISEWSAYTRAVDSILNKGKLGYAYQGN